MRVCVTEVTSARGRSVARLLTAAGHEVSGVAAGSGCLLLLGGDPVAVRGLTAAAERAGARIVLLSGAEPALRVPEVAVLSSGVPALIVRAAPTASRRAGAETIRTLAGVLHGGADTAWRLLHDDDLDRFLVAAVLSGRTGTVDLAGPGTVTGAQAREVLGDVGRFGARGLPRAEPAPAADLPPEWEVRPGWGAREVLADLARGLPGRRPAGWRRRILPSGAQDDPEAVPLPADAVPGRLPPSDGHPLVPAPGDAGEFDDAVDDRFGLAAIPTWAGLPVTPLTPLSLDLQAGALRQAAAVTASIIGVTGVVADQWVNRLASVHGHRIHLNVSVAVVVASVLPDPYGPALHRQAVAGVPPALRPDAADFTANAAARNAAAGRLRRLAAGFERWAGLVEAAGRAEVPAPGPVRDLDDDGLHVRCLLWRDRLGHAWSVAAVGAVLTGECAGRSDAVAAFTRALRDGTAERSARLASAGVLAAAQDGPYLTLDELFGPPADVRERVARRRAERTRLAGAPASDVLQLVPMGPV